MKSNESWFVGSCIHTCSIRQHHHRSSIPMHVHIQYIMLYTFHLAAHSLSQNRGKRVCVRWSWKKSRFVDWRRRFVCVCVYLHLCLFNSCQWKYHSTFECAHETCSVACLSRQLADYVGSIRLTVLSKLRRPLDLE